MRFPFCIDRILPFLDRFQTFFDILLWRNQETALTFYLKNDYARTGSICLLPYCGMWDCMACHASLRHPGSDSACLSHGGPGLVCGKCLDSGFLAVDKVLYQDPWDEFLQNAYDIQDFYYLCTRFRLER